MDMNVKGRVLKRICGDRSRNRKLKKLHTEM
jgi:hypothetical protein